MYRGVPYIIQCQQHEWYDTVDRLQIYAFKAIITS